MIPKGLKVGDTFEDFGNTYKVTKVVGDNYESERVGISSPVTLSNYSDTPYAQLKKLCAEKGLDAKGSKEELIARLEG
jgi:hypothetical protein